MRRLRSLLVAALKVVAAAGICLFLVMTAVSGVGMLVYLITQ